MFVCKICSTEVKPGQAFCPTCGADVVENYETVCSVCGSKNVGGSRYCAKCGGILNVLRKPVCNVCGMKNLPGAQYCVGCGAPLQVDSETHSDADMLDARKAKLKVDSIMRERMAACDREIAEKRAKADEERVAALKAVDAQREDLEADYQGKVKALEEYKAKLEEFGSEDVAQLQTLSKALKDFAVYYADPYSQLEDDEIDGDSYVCPACGTVNPANATACTNCGRNRARALLLLAKNKIKQSPPVKRKRKVIEPPEEKLKNDALPSLEEFKEQQQEKDAPPQQETPLKENPSDFSGHAPFAYPYPPYGYPYPMPQAAGAYPPAYVYGADGKPYQMPPIVQPVAFVPYVTQDQPLMQYTPQAEEKRQPHTAADPDKKQ